MSGAERVTIETVVNGAAVRLDVHPSDLLLDVLRDHLGLTGAKRSCDVQVCGTCTVLLDGQPVSACTTLVHEARGRAVLTIEGLAELPEFARMEEVFTRHTALQCGYCTPGMALTISRPAGLGRAGRRRGHGARGAVGERLPMHRLPGDHRRGAGAGAMTTTPSTPLETGSALGHSVARADAAEKLRGQARYVGDIAVPGMLHGEVLRSEIPAGRIRSIDTAAAQAMPGVRCILVGADLRDLDPFYGHAIRDRPIIAIDVVRFAGEPVAVVAAETEAQAEAAVRAIRVDYEPLPGAVDLDRALAPDGPLVHTEPARGGAFHGLGNLPERLGNVCYRYELDWGDTDAAFADADVVVEDVYEFGSAYQYSMETHACIAQVEGEDITLWANCQHPFLVRAEMASVFGVPLGRVRIIVPFLGGGFGSKSYTRMEPLTIAVARKAGRPVRVVNRVDEAILTSRQHAMRVRLRTAARADGTLVAREARCWFDTGAYADNGPRVVATGGDAAPGPYRWESARVCADCVYTNTSPAGSYRAFGAVHMQWAGEQQVDQIARRLGIDPLEMRRRNLLRPGRGSSDPAASPSTPTSWATSRRWPRPWDGRATASPGWGAACRWGCSRRAPIRSRARPCASRPTARSRSSWAPRRSDRGLAR